MDHLDLRPRDEEPVKVLSWVLLILAAIVLMHWLTAGLDEIIKGPPETPDGSYCLFECQGK